MTIYFSTIFHKPIHQLLTASSLYSRPLSDYFLCRIPQTIFSSYPVMRPIKSFLYSSTNCTGEEKCAIRFSFVRGICSGSVIGLMHSLLNTYGKWVFKLHHVSAGGIPWSNVGQKRYMKACNIYVLPQDL